MHKRYQDIEEPEKGGWSEWFQFLHKHPGKAARMACCDCSLVHDVQMKIGDDGKPIIRMKVNRRATSAMRRKSH